MNPPSDFSPSASRLPPPRTSAALTRRAFLRRGLAGVLFGAAVPQLVSSRVLGQEAPSKRVTLGFIGVGSHGFGVNLKSFLQQDDCQVEAVCDVFKSRIERARAAVNTHYGTKDCAAFADFRDLLARPEIDAVVISTPDHWHVPMSLLAVAAGKKVFCEKPTLTIAEGRKLADTVKTCGAGFAVGLEDRAVVYYHMLAQAVRNGAIGELRRIEVGLVEKPAFAREEPAPVPADLISYNLWLGPAPFRPYTPRLTEPQVWRQIRDFSGGSLTDWGAHLVDTAQVANFAEATSPTEVSGTGVIPPGCINDVPQKYTLSYRYENGVTMDVKSGGVSLRFEGTEGWVGNTGWSGPLQASDMNIFRRKYDPKTNKLWPRRPREQRDFLDSIRSGQPPMYTAEALHRLSTTLHLGAIAMELGRPLRWNPHTEEFTDDPAANALRARTPRTAWEHA